MSEDRSTETRERILEAAERLFAEHGFHATSVRAITSLAGVNLASVHYHFGSKDGLIRALFQRCLGQLNARRLEMLEAVEKEAAPGEPPVEGILEALLGPTLRLYATEADGGVTFVRLMGRVHGEPNQQVAEIIGEEMREIVRRFSHSLGRALPFLPPDEVLYRLHFAVGAMAFTLTGSHLLYRLSGGICRGVQTPEDIEDMLRRLIAFLAGGMKVQAPRFVAEERT